ncbi:membrane protein insertase YidC [Desulfobacterales bacterium HSG2]|nr:membrane protein insertase YidC [Desulfobacterales bacterium HSG2]
MEQARLFLAIALSFIVFLVWGYFEKPAHKPEKSPPSEQTVEKEPYTEESRPATTDIRPAATDATAPEPLPDVVRASRTITVDTPLYTVKISEKGAVFRSFILKDYKETVDEDSPLKEIIPGDVQTGSLQTGFAGNSIPGMKDAVFSANIEADTVNILNQTEAVSFSWRTPDGIVLEKHFLFSPETYLIGLDVVVKNGSDRTVRDNLILSVVNHAPKSDTYDFRGVSAFISGSLEQIKTKDIEDKNIYSGNLMWLAIEDRYFLSGIIPVNPAEASMHLFLKDKIVESQYMHPTCMIDSGTRQHFEFDLFLGPKSLEILKGLKRFQLTGHALEALRAEGMPENLIAELEGLKYQRYSGEEEFDAALRKTLGESQTDQYKSLILKHTGKLDYNLDKLIDLGWFDFIAKPCLMAMKFLYSFIPNYGISIIILTVFIKLLLWPLGNKSYKSMNEMKKIQPLMTEIREKYKDDKKKMNQELMNLYKTYKINPMGGCLPMILQIPVFFAFYKMLYVAIELRHAPFFAWINDLSAPDRLGHFDFSIPFMDPPCGIPVLTIIMGATMLLQQKMSPPPGDPAQAKMMMFMPIIFTFIFINFSSGLVLYWLVNNILSISQQYYILKKTT